MESTQEDKKVEQQPAATTAPVEEAKKKDSKAEREAKKQARLAERQAKTQEQKEFKKDPNDPCASKFGDLELNRSQSDPEKRYDKKFIQVHEIEESHAGQEIIVRGRLNGSRAAGKKLVFVVIRERFATVQALLAVNLPDVSEGMAEYTRRIPKESIIEVRAKVTIPEKPI